MSQKIRNTSWNKFSKLRFSKKSLSRSVRNIEKSTIRHARRFVSSRLDRLSLVKRVVFSWVALVFILAGVSTLQWLNYRQSYTVDAATSGGTYSEGVLGPLETLNPIFARSSAEKSASKLLFASLYAYDETGNLKGDLAESVSVNETETKYTVTLRPGAKWSDGAALTSQDVVFTVDLLRNPDTQSSLSGWGSFKAEATDARTIVFTLPGAYAPFLHTLTFPVLPHHVLAGIKPAELREQAFSSSPTTSGPFALRMLQNTSSDGSRKIAHLVANPRYLHGTPKLERFQLNVYTSREDIEKALKTNEIIATPELVYEKLPEPIQKMYQNRSYTVNDGVYAMFNTRDGLLESQPVRRALALAVNVNELRDEIANPTDHLSGPILNNQIDGDLPGIKYDLEEAKKLLDEEGWRVANNGVRSKDGQPLTLRMVALSGANFSETTEKLSKIWSDQLNIKVEVEMVDPLDPSRSVLQSVLQPRNYDVLVYELVIGGDPDVYAYWHSSQATSNGLNFSNYSSVISDEALSSGRARIDSKYRRDRYQAFVKRWLSDMPALPLYQVKIDYIYSKSGTSLNKDAVLVYPENRYANVIYWSVNKASVYKTP